jgi:hypothetical protein
MLHRKAGHMTATDRAQNGVNYTLAKEASTYEPLGLDHGTRKN